MSQIKVEPAIIEDVPKIGKIAYGVAKIHYRQVPKEFKKPTLATQTDYIRKCVLDENILVLRANTDKDIVGYVIVYFNTFPDEYFRFNKRAFIGSIGVDADYQRQGIGKALLTAVEKEVKKRKISFVEIDYYTFNQAAAGLYSHCGYQEKKRYVSKFIK